MGHDVTARPPPLSPKIVPIIRSMAMRLKWEQETPVKNRLDNRLICINQEQEPISAYYAVD